MKKKIIAAGTAITMALVGAPTAAAQNLSSLSSLSSSPAAVQPTPTPSYYDLWGCPQIVDS